jgi:hypothetical protein
MQGLGNDASIQGALSASAAMMALTSMMPPVAIARQLAMMSQVPLDYSINWSNWSTMCFQAMVPNNYYPIPTDYSYASNYLNYQTQTQTNSVTHSNAPSNYTPASSCSNSATSCRGLPPKRSPHAVRKVDMKKKRDEHRAYHKVAKHELKHATQDVKNRAAQELEGRAKYARKYYGGKYDDGHAHHMRCLYEPIANDLDAKLSMSLSTLSDLSSIGAR